MKLIILITLILQSLQGNAIVTPQEGAEGFAQAIEKEISTINETTQEMNKNTNEQPELEDQFVEKITQNEAVVSEAMPEDTKENDQKSTDSVDRETENEIKDLTEKTIETESLAEAISENLKELSDL